MSDTRSSPGLRIRRGVSSPSPRVRAKGRGEGPLRGRPLPALAGGGEDKRRVRLRLPRDSSCFPLYGGAERAAAGARSALPAALSFERVGNLFGHIGLVVLGQHRVGPEQTAGVERALRDHALPFPE